MRTAQTLSLAFVLLPQLLPAAETFRGSLERVTQHSVSILLTDGRLIDARLPDKDSSSGTAISGSHQIGDQVELRCTAIHGIWDEDSKRTHYLEMNAIRFVAKPTAEQMAIAVKSRDWRWRGNLLHPPPGVMPEAEPEAPQPSAAPVEPNDPSPDPEQFLEFARQAILRRAGNLPNFIANESVECSAANSSPPHWQPASTVGLEVTFKGQSEQRKTLTLDGKPYSDPGIPPGCIGWSGGFGTYLVPLFHPRCGVTFQFTKKAESSGQSVYIYKYASPPEGCFSSSFSGYQRAYPTHEGYVAIVYPSGNLVQLRDRALKFPRTYPIEQLDQTVTWGPVKIDDTLHLLPVEYEKIMSLRQGAQLRVTVKYEKHRHFEANSTMTFH